MFFATGKNEAPKSICFGATGVVTAVAAGEFLGLRPGHNAHRFVFVALVSWALLAAALVALSMGAVDAGNDEWACPTVTGFATHALPLLRQMCVGFRAMKDCTGWQVTAGGTLKGSTAGRVEANDFSCDTVKTFEGTPITNLAHLKRLVASSNVRSRQRARQLVVERSPAAITHARSPDDAALQSSCAVLKFFGCMQL